MQYAHLFKDTRQERPCPPKPKFNYITHNMEKTYVFNKDTLVKVPSYSRAKMIEFLQDWEKEKSSRLIILYALPECILIDFIIFHILKKEGITVNEIATLRCNKTLAFDVETIIQPPTWD